MSCTMKTVLSVVKPASGNFDNSHGTYDARMSTQCIQHLRVCRSGRPVALSLGHRKNSQRSGGPRQ